MRRRKERADPGAPLSRLLLGRVTPKGGEGKGGGAPGEPPPAGCGPGCAALQPASAGGAAALSTACPTTSFSENLPGHTALGRERHQVHML